MQIPTYGPAPTVNPSGAALGYQTISTNADQFGAGLAQSAVAGGAALQKAGDQLGEAAIKEQAIADENVVNDAQKRYLDQDNAILHQPQKLDAAGNPVPGTGGYFAQRGDAARSGYSDALGALKDAYSETRLSLTPPQQKMFDALSRGLYTRSVEAMGRHVDTETGRAHDLSVNALAATQADAAAAAGMGGDTGPGSKFIELSAQARSLYQSTAQNHGLSPEVGDVQFRAWQQHVAQKIFNFHVNSNDPTAVRNLANSLAMPAANGQGDASGQPTGPQGQLSPEVAAAVGQSADAHPEAPWLRDYLTRTALVENSGKPTDDPTKKYTGAFQLGADEAARYGVADRNVPAQSAEAAARLALDNQAGLTRALGRPATPGEVYLAHQQGLGGAIALLQNPGMPAVQALAAGGQKAPAAAVTQNGGDADMTAAQFTQHVVGDQFGGHSGTSGLVFPKTGTWVDLMTPDVRASLWHQANERAGNLEILGDKARKDASNAAATGYVTSMLNGRFNNLDTLIANDPNLEAGQKLSLTNAYRAELDRQTNGRPREPGPAFVDAYAGVVSHQINSQADLVPLLGNGQLSVTGYTYLTKALEGRQSDEGSQINEYKKGFLGAAAQRLNPMNANLNPTWKQDLQSVTIAMDQLIPRLQAKGMAPAQIFDPKSKDGVYSLLDSAAPSQAQLLSNATNGAFGKAAGGAPDVMALTRKEDLLAEAGKAAKAGDRARWEQVVKRAIGLGIVRPNIEAPVSADPEFTPGSAAPNLSAPIAR